MLGALAATVWVSPAGAQQGEIWDGNASRVTRPALEELRTRYERAAESPAYSEVLRSEAREQADLVGQRLEQGDFRVGDRVSVYVEDNVEITDTLAVTADATVLVLTALATVALDLVTAVVLGVLVAGALALRQIARDATLEETPLAGVASDRQGGTAEEHALLDAHIVAYRLDGPLFFVGAHQSLLELSELSDIRVVILRMSRVVTLDAMGTPMRSQSFHEAYYGDMGDNTLPDQVAGMKELASRHPWIDLDRAGIYGHSGGGFASTDAILRYPDFFKVAVSQAGNHDNRSYEDDWGEKWQGLLEVRSDGSTNYDNQANQLLARNLKGKLLLAHGAMDDNVPPSNTMLVVDALIKANKNFDLLMFPNARHGYGPDNNYMMRRQWDYFVKHLLGAEPPEDYQIGRRPTP